MQPYSPFLKRKIELINTLKNLFTKNTRYTVTELPSGRFGIISDNGEVFKSYSRKTDAVRGAERAGLTLA